MFRKNKNKNKQGVKKGVSKFRGNRNSVVKSKNRKKRKFPSKDKDEIENAKKVQKVEEHIASSSESSEDESHDPLKQLLYTFNPNSQHKQNLAVESGDETDDSNTDNDEMEKKSALPDAEPENYSSKDDNNLSESENEFSDEISINTQQLDDLSQTDSFVNHFCYDLSDNFSDFLQNQFEKNTESVEWLNLGKLAVSLPKYTEITSKNQFSIIEDKKFVPLGTIPAKIDFNHLDPISCGIKSQIARNIKNANPVAKGSGDHLLSPLQNELFSLINNYQDVLYPEQNFDNCEQIRFLYSLHSINHILKTRTKVLNHNSKLKNKNDAIFSDDYRDQGLVRPKVLIIVPFRDSALKIVKMFMEILTPGENGQVVNKKRFLDDFSGNELHFPKKNPKPEDYEQLFSGNTDDVFKIGIKIGKKSLGLYSDFYKSDIIIGSPLGLRMVVGATGEAERDFDFLNSIEILILDQTEVFLMQNWDHLIHILDHLHLQPKNNHGTDFSRVRNWALNGFSKYYRQTLIFSSFVIPEINSIFNKKCFNFAGSIKILNPINRDAAILKITFSLPQVFRKFNSDSFLNCLDDRYNFFISKILPNFREGVMKNTLIFVPNYFDFVKLRNFFKKEDLSFVQICEYSKTSKVARARDIFFHGDKHFLLYSERFHFFHRIRLKGIRHLIFYQPPVFSSFYAEMCNLMQESNQNKKVGNSSNMSVTVIYSKYDLQQLSGIVGSERAFRMVNSEKNYHMITSSDS